ncbi:hypothetical protein D3C71_1759360 [compost metagenome]
MGAQAEAVRAVFQVGADFRLGREHARPVRVRGERERIEVRLHVAGAAGVVVVAPGAAHRPRLLEDQEIFLAGLLEANGHAQAGKAAADDGDVAGDFGA